METWKILLAVTGFGIMTKLPAYAQQPSNDGFQRRNGQMQVLRNGQARPMTRDIHLPTGATVTKDGFVVAPNGQRTELREGQGCDLRGRTVTVLTAANGTVALDAPAVLPASAAPSPQRAPAQGLLETVFGIRRDDGRYYRYKKAHSTPHFLSLIMSYLTINPSFYYI